MAITATRVSRRMLVRQSSLPAAAVWADMSEVFPSARPEAPIGTVRYITEGLPDSYLCAVGLRRYLEVLRTPGVARVVAFTATGRLPFAIVPLSIVLLMREEAYDYGEIGVVVGAEALAVGVTAGFVGRLVDRVGDGGWCS